MIRPSFPLLSFLALAVPASASAPAPIAGRWTTDDGKAVIEIAPCGANLCGKILRVLVAEPAGGARDAKNPDRTKRDRKLVGTPVLWNLTASGAAWKGQGYSPTEGRNFTATVTPAGGTLNVKGCVALFCRTQLWTRAR